MHKHSESFQHYCKVLEIPGSNQTTLYLISERLHEDFRQESKRFTYKQVQNFLLELWDQQYNIITTVADTPEKIQAVMGEAFDPSEFTTGSCMFRDATAALPLSACLDSKHPIFLMFENLLVALSIARVLDYVLVSRAHINSQQAEFYQAARIELKNYYAKFMQQMLEWQNKIVSGHVLHTQISAHFDKFLEEFNAEMVGLLRKCGLDRGIDRDDINAYTKILIYYRQMSCLLDPAPAMRTVIMTGALTQIETHYPITEKTDAQKKMLEQMQVVVLNPTPTEIDSHNAKPIAYQEVFAMLARLCMRDDRRFSSYMSTEQVMTVKNGYLVHDLYIFSARSELNIEYWSVRCGAIVYNGKFATEEVKIANARENIRQIKLALSKKFTGKPHLVYNILNTYSLYENQTEIVSGTQKATRLEEVEFTNFPLNFEGTFHFAEHAPSISANVSTAERIPVPFSVKQNLQSAINIVGRNRNPNQVPIVSCLRGNDRTGTFVLALQRYHDQQVYTKAVSIIAMVNSAELSEKRVCARSHILITALAVPGQPGLKDVSRPGDYYPDDVSKATYIPAADRKYKLRISASKFLEVRQIQTHSACAHDLIQIRFELEKQNKLNGWWSSSDNREKLLHWFSMQLALAQLKNSSQTIGDTFMLLLFQEFEDATGKKYIPIVELTRIRSMFGGELQVDIEFARDEVQRLRSSFNRNRFFEPVPEYLPQSELAQSLLQFYDQYESKRLNK